MSREPIATRGHSTQATIGRRKGAALSPEGNSPVTPPVPVDVGVNVAVLLELELTVPSPPKAEEEDAGVFVVLVPAEEETAPPPLLLLLLLLSPVGRALELAAELGAEDEGLGMLVLLMLLLVLLLIAPAELLSAVLEQKAKDSEK